MNIDDFSYMRCENCKNVKIFPIQYENNMMLLSRMSDIYDSMCECCNNPNVCYSSVHFGVRNGLIKISDLPLALRKEFSLEVTHEYDCGEHALIVTKYNGDKVLVYVDGERIIILDGMTENSIYIGEDKND